MTAQELPAPFIETVLTGWWTTCLEILPTKERARGNTDSRQEGIGRHAPCKSPVMPDAPVEVRLKTIVPVKKPPPPGERIIIASRAFRPIACIRISPVTTKEFA